MRTPAVIGLVVWLSTTGADWGFSVKRATWKGLFGG
jgi:hypothetical protein